MKTAYSIANAIANKCDEDRYSWYATDCDIQSDNSMVFDIKIKIIQNCLLIFLSSVIRNIFQNGLLAM